MRTALTLGAALVFGAAACTRAPLVRTDASPTPKPVVSPTPISIPFHKMETARLFNGIKVNAAVAADFGTTASAERTDPESYTLDLHVKVRVPKANTSLPEIAKLNPALPTVLPVLETMLATAEVSDFYDDMYRRKVSTINRDLVRLEQLISRHNFFDCETILNVQHPETKRRAVLIQADMDVVMDGSDSDRVPVVDGSSMHFQPTTSYRWPKKSGTANPFLAAREEKLKAAEQELGKAGSDAKAQELKASVPRLRAEADDLKKHSFLVSTADPFVVMPGPMLAGKSPFAPKIGDYCVVLFNDKLYPAIVGDAGPTYKAGEASLRMCKELNAAANAMNRPVSELKVTYLVFPGSADKPWDAPDLEKWRTRCDALLKEIGGYEGELFAWEDVTKPKPTPTPEPSASPAASASPAVQASPSASPEPTPLPKMKASPAKKAPSPKPAAT